MISSEEASNHRLRLRELTRNRQQIMVTFRAILRRQKLFYDNPRQTILHESPSKAIKPFIFECSTDQAALQMQKKEVIEAQEAIAARNRRMLGGLKGHLRIAENRLQQENEKRQEKQQIQERVASRQREGLEKQSEVKFKALQDQLEILKTKKVNNFKEIMEIETKLLTNSLCSYEQELEHFIITKTQPPLAWLPATTTPPLSVVLAQQLAERRQRREIAKQALRDYDPTTDPANIVSDNEKAYYKNYLRRYWHEQAPFFFTHTTPSLAWAPNKAHPVLDAAMQASKKMRADDFQKTLSSILASSIRQHVKVEDSEDSGSVNM